MLTQQKYSLNTKHIFRKRNQFMPNTTSSPSSKWVFFWALGLWSCGQREVGGRKEKEHFFLHVWWNKASRSKYFTSLSAPYMEKEMATHSSTLAWRTPWTEEHAAVRGVAKSRTWLSYRTITGLEDRWDRPLNRSAKANRGTLSTE